VSVGERNCEGEWVIEKDRGERVSVRNRDRCKVRERVSMRERKGQCERERGGVSLREREEGRV